MGLTRAKRAFLLQTLDEERVKTIEDGLAELSKELEEAGIDFKETGWADRWADELVAIRHKKTTPADPIAAAILSDLRQLAPRALSPRQEQAVKELGRDRNVAPYLQDLAVRRVLPGGE
jgi:hypothetical protein